MGPITPISAQIPVVPANPPIGSSAPPGEFQNLLESSVQNLEAHRSDAKQAVQQFLSGETEDVHKVALATQRAELSSELFMQIRNKVVSAYQEIMKMQM